MISLPTWLNPVVDLAASGDAVLVPASALGNYGPQPRDAAVLIAFSGTSFDTGTILLQQRGSAMRNHPGQVSFPGGRTEPDDADRVATALREAYEEVALPPEQVHILGSGAALPVIVSRFNVTPVFGYAPSFAGVEIADAAEVAHVAAVPVRDLVNPEHRGVTQNARGYVAPAFEASGLFIWGFTAMMLDGMLRQVGWHEEYDEARFLEMPEAVRYDGPGAASA